MHGFRPPASRAVLALACCAILAAAAWAVPDGEVAAFWAARLLALVTAGSVAWAVDRRGALPPLAAPAFLLPLAALMLYSIGPSVYLVLIDKPVLAIPSGADPADLRVVMEPVFEVLYPYYATTAGGERLVLGFCAVTWLLMLVVDRFTLPAAVAVLSLAPGKAAALSILSAATFRLAGWLSLTGQAVEVLPILSQLAAAYVVVGSVRRGGGGAMLAIATLTAGILLLSPAHAKLASLFAIVGLGALLLGAPARLRAGLLALLVVLPLGAAIAVNVSRNIIHSGNVVSATLSTLQWKVVMRQAETLFCLNFVVRDRLRDGGGESPFYFAYALVPRAVWSEKPILPGGSEFNRPYCGIVIESNHSSSVTLAGEPLVRAGIPGGIVAMAIMLGLLGLGFRAWKGGFGAAPVVALALAPALVDFDQGFTMYLAGAVKTALILTVVALAVESVARRRRQAGQRMVD